MFVEDAAAVLQLIGGVLVGKLRQLVPDVSTREKLNLVHLPSVGGIVIAVVANVFDCVIDATPFSPFKNCATVMVELEVVLK